MVQISQKCNTSNKRERNSQSEFNCVIIIINKSHRGLKSYSFREQKLKSNNPKSNLISVIHFSAQSSTADDNESLSNTHHLRLAAGAAIDILHLLVCCARKKIKTFTILSQHVLTSCGTQVRHESSGKALVRRHVHLHQVSEWVSEWAFMCVCVCVCVKGAVRCSKRVWEVKLPNSSAAAGELLTGLLGLIVCMGELGG